LLEGQIGITFLKNWPGKRVSIANLYFLFFFFRQLVVAGTTHKTHNRSLLLGSHKSYTGIMEPLLAVFTT